MTSTLKRTTLALALLAPLAGWSQISVSVNIAPPPLPLYAQPPVPGDGYIWTPGYWSWDASSGDYIWIPGTWVQPPSVGLLWTPGYWAFGDGGYFWHGGYWGDHVGYYGGLNYGYGYNGGGYYGGRWEHDHFRYNQAVNNIPRGRVHDVYTAPVPARPATRESFNGGASRYRAQPTPNERQFQGAQHGGPTSAQMDHEHRAMTMPEQRMANNHGVPPTAATPHPGGFGEPGVEHVRAEPPQAHGRPQGQPGRVDEGARPQVQPARPNEVARPQVQAPHGNEGGRPQDRPGRVNDGGRPEGEQRR
jgi:hypothetical protein